jgi:predicted dehydrogenase
MEMTASRLRVALVGCGQIADAHLGEIRKLPLAEVVAVCDRERDLATQAAARFDVPAIFDDLEEMLALARPDVVHITTPPHTHKPIAIEVLRAGAHAYVEKPFAIDLAETDEVLAVAESTGRLVCIGHDQLFDPAWEECRDLYRSGLLGRIVHIDAVLGYDFTGPFGSLVSTDRAHWVHRLPGGIFHNTISHAVYKIAEFLPDEHPQIQGFWAPSLDSGSIPTELRVLVRGAETTASLVSSCAARPVQRVTRVYGTLQTVEVDLDGRLVRSYPAPRLRGALARIEIPYRHLREAKRHFRRAIRRFFKNEIHYFTGMRNLFELFYRAIVEQGQPPIPYSEIRRVTAIMDGIFAACRDPRHDQPAAGVPGDGAGQLRTFCNASG